MRRIYNDAVDDLLARIDDGGDVAWYLKDNIGSVRDMLDESGAATGHRDYTTFGKIDSETGSGFDRYGYTSREFDVETEMQYNRARWYDPSIGRWISQDPLGFDAGDSNLYRYVNNRATMGTDPSGLDVIWLFDTETWAGGLFPTGHPAVLVGNPEDGWDYFSIRLAKPTDQEKKYASGSDKATIFHWHGDSLINFGPGSSWKMGGYKFNRAILIPTTREQDANIVKDMKVLETVPKA